MARIFFGVCTWGLGHATRDLPVIKALLAKGHKVAIASSGRTLDLLKRELPHCKCLEIFDYRLPYGKKKFSVAKLLLTFPKFVRDIKKEHRALKSILRREKFDLIISDNRFGIYSNDVPSLFISHQLRFVAPKGFEFGEVLTEYFNFYATRHFSEIIVPDFERNDLSGRLSHNLKFPWQNINYIGPLMDFQKTRRKPDIDVFISISGPEPQRTIFEKKIMPQLHLLQGKIVVTLGKPEENLHEKQGNVEIFSYLRRQRQIDTMNRSKIVVTRSGYTTIMELALLGKKALFVPTEGQTEQVYLSQYHERKKTFHSVKLAHLNLKKDIAKALSYNGFKIKKGHEPIKNFMKIVGHYV